jgi:arylsulfatase A-like enzyme
MRSNSAIIAMRWICLFVFGVESIGCSDAPGDPPNLLLITVDTLRPDRLECYGGAEGVGRSICSLGDRGAQYQWALSPAPSTAPAIASIMTSRYPSYHGVTQFGVSRLEASAQTLAESLSLGGFSTGAVISNPVLSRSRKLDQGFETYDFRMNRAESRQSKIRERDAEHATDAALEWIQGADSPWFLWVHYQDPHGPYQPPGAGAIGDEGVTRILRLLADHSGYRGIPAYQSLPNVFSIDAYEKRYIDEIRYLDSHVGRLLGEVAEVDPDTGILLTADHAEAFGEDEFWFAHGHSVGLEQIRVPLLWKPPGGVQPQRLATPVSTLDVAPTLLAAAKVTAPESFQGISLPTGNQGPADGKQHDRILYTEHRMRAGLAAGNYYYTRDREAMSEPVRDRITGGWLQPMPARGVELNVEGLLPNEATTDSEVLSTELEVLMVDFLSRAGSQQEPRRSDLPSDVREQLEALGYLE